MVNLYTYQNTPTGVISSYINGKRYKKVYIKSDKTFYDGETGFEERKDSLYIYFKDTLRYDDDIQLSIGTLILNCGGLRMSSNIPRCLLEQAEYIIKKNMCEVMIAKEFLHKIKEECYFITNAHKMGPNSKYCIRRIDDIYIDNWNYVTKIVSFCSYEDLILVADYLNNHPEIQFKKVMIYRSTSDINYDKPFDISLFGKVSIKKLSLYDPYFKGIRKFISLSNVTSIHISYNSEKYNLDDYNMDDNYTLIKFVARGSKVDYPDVLELVKRNKMLQEKRRFITTKVASH
jgi:hypothetical protein